MGAARVGGLVRDDAAPSTDAITQVLASAGFRIAAPLEVHLVGARALPTTLTKDALPASDALDLRAVVHARDPAPRILREPLEEAAHPAAERRVRGVAPHDEGGPACLPRVGVPSRRLAAIAVLEEPLAPEDGVGADLAIDRDAMVKLLGGLAVPAVGCVPPDHPWFGTPAFKIRYDPAEARKLMAEAGYGAADMNRVAASGHSFGTYTMAALAGMVRFTSEFVARSATSSRIDIEAPLVVVPILEPRVQLDWLFSPPVSLLVGLGLRINLVDYSHGFGSKNEQGVVVAHDFYLEPWTLAPALYLGVGISL